MGASIKIGGGTIRRFLNEKGIATSTAIIIAMVVIAAIGIGVWIATRPKPERKIGIIVSIGGLGDKSFNDLNYAGAKRAAEELGMKLDVVEPAAIPEMEGLQRAFAKAGIYDVIICVGFFQADPLSKVAPDFPNQKFILTDAVVDQPNVASLLFKANEGGFLLGVLATHLTTAKKVGVVGGMDIPLIHDFFMGFENGLKWADPTVTYIPPLYVGRFDDPVTGKELAITLIRDHGVDVIWAAAGKSGLGALEAASERGIKAFGVDACQCYLTYGGRPQHIPASMTKRLDVAIHETVVAAVRGKWRPGVHVGGVKEGWIGLCRLPGEEPFWEKLFGFEHAITIPPAALAHVENAKAGIIAGKIVVPRPW